MQNKWLDVCVLYCACMYKSFIHFLHSDSCGTFCPSTFKIGFTDFFGMYRILYLEWIPNVHTHAHTYTLNAYEYIKKFLSFQRKPVFGWFGGEGWRHHMDLLLYLSQAIFCFFLLFCLVTLGRKRRENYNNANEYKKKTNFNRVKKKSTPHSIKLTS